VRRSNEKRARVENPLELKPRKVDMEKIYTIRMAGQAQPYFDFEESALTDVEDLYHIRGRALFDALFIAGVNDQGQLTVLLEGQNCWQQDKTVGNTVLLTSEYGNGQESVTVNRLGDKIIVVYFDGSMQVIVEVWLPVRVTNKRLEMAINIALEGVAMTIN
jgi:GH43 family beta-xylosidase